MASVKSCVKHLTANDGMPEASELEAALLEVMEDTASQAQTGAFLMALALRPPSQTVLQSFAKVMQSLAKPCEVPKPSGEHPVTVDIVGTGGDGKDTFSVSTASGLVMAACGATVTKHGNRSSSGSVGSADFLEALGARISLSGPQVAAVVKSCGYGFLFAPMFHTSMKTVAQCRKQLGFRTVFNLLGPLINPSQPDCQVIGVSSKTLGPIFAEILKAQGRKHCLVVHGDNGIDEISPEGSTHVWEVREQAPIQSYQITPADLGVESHPLSEVFGGTASERVDQFRNVLLGNPSAIRDFIVLNAAAGVYVAGLADSLKAAADLVRQALDSGKAADVVDRYVAQTQRFASSTAAATGGKADILAVITAQRRQDVLAARAELSLDELKAKLSSAPPLVDFRARLLKSAPLAVMAEVKRASPSKGLIAANVVAAEQALKYAESEAAVISVLTEPTWFLGTLKDMSSARKAVDALGDQRPAILRKDFLIDEYQLVEARVHGADTVLLIVAILSDEELTTLMACARGLGMEPLVEVANTDEMKRAMAAGAKVVGINNRNLKDFTVDTNTTRRVLEGAGVDATKSDILVCALSGIANRLDVQRYRAAGCHAVLVGEYLMRSKDPRAMIAHLRGFGPEPLVKICGLKNEEDAVATATAGADFIGLVFAPKSKRCVTVEEARKISRAVKRLRSSGPLLTLDCRDSESSSDAEAEVILANRATQLRRACAVRPLLVGVFANQAPEDVLKIAQDAELDIVQLSGTEGMDGGKSIPGFTIIKAVHIGAETTPASILASLPTANPLPDCLLLDTKNKTMMGGTGETFDWAVAAKLQQSVPLFLAGGLAPDNGAEATRQVHPFGVDISSGVETDGVKDLKKIVEFIKAVKLG